MKKFTAILLSLLLLLSVLVGCNDTTDKDIWDGSVASSFAGGSGTSSDPYRIATSSQLAYLAQQINAGVDYTARYFRLENDLDLNNIEWTPIGNGTYSFSGIFDGNDHSVENLKIIGGVSFDKTYPQTVSRQYASGLFGTCIDPTIKNLSIDGAEIVIQDTIDRQEIYTGVLIGVINVNTATEISNVKISNSKITADFTQESSVMNLRIGGVSGAVYAENDTDSKIYNIQSDIMASIENGHGSYNHIGSLFGFLSTYYLCDVKDCASYLSVDVDTENCYATHNYFGAFGATQISSSVLSMTNLFSKVTINKIYDDFHGYPAYTANAIIGEAYHGKQSDGTVIGGYKFENLFGCVEQTDKATNETQISEQLYGMSSHALYTENNCQGCKALPDTHGFDLNIWDLSDPENPKIK